MAPLDAARQADKLTGIANVLLAIQGISIRFGGIVALDGVSFDVREGTIVGLIGPNGAGKTTMFNCVTRVYTPNAGNILLDGQSLLRLARHQVIGRGLARTFQNVELFPRMTVIENVLCGLHIRVGTHPLHFLMAGLPFGTLKAIELARAIVSRPRLLLLDEPAGGLNHDEVSELGELIRRIHDELDLTTLVVEHHMNLVMGISEQVVVLDFGKKIAEGKPREVRENQAVIDAYLGAEADGAA